MQFLNAIQFADGSKQRSAPTVAGGAGNSWGSFRSLVPMAGMYLDVYPAIANNATAFVNNQFLLYPLWLNKNIIVDTLYLLSVNGSGAAAGSYVEFATYGVHTATGLIAKTQDLGQMTLEGGGGRGLSLPATKTLSTGWLGMRFVVTSGNVVLSSCSLAFASEIPTVGPSQAHAGFLENNVAALPASYQISTSSGIAGFIPRLSVKVAP